MSSKHVSIISSLEKKCDFDLESGKSRTHKINLMSFLLPHQNISIVQYRIKGELLDLLLRPLLIDNKHKIINENIKQFINLTYTLRIALATHPELAWSDTTRYLQKEDKFTDINVYVLKECDTELTKNHVVNAVIDWLSADLLKDRLGDLVKGYKVINDNVERTEQLLLPPSIDSPAVFPDDNRYFKASALKAANYLRDSKSIMALLCPSTALSEGKRLLKPALRISSQVIQIIGAPEQKKSNRWVSNVLCIKARSEIGYHNLSIDISLHSKIYGDISSTSLESTTSRQLVIFQHKNNQLLISQYPFIITPQGASFEKESDKDDFIDLAGQSISRLYHSKFGESREGILKASKYNDHWNMPLLAQGLGDTHVAEYTGATAPERNDVFKVVQKALEPYGYSALPPVSLLKQSVPRKSKSNNCGVNVFVESTQKDSQSLLERQKQLVSYLKSKGGAINFRLILDQNKYADSVLKGNEWIVAFNDWSGLKTVERWTTPNENRQFAFSDKGLPNKERYGDCSWTLFRSSKKDKDQIEAKATFRQAINISEKYSENIWFWDFHIELINDIEKETELKSIKIDNIDLFKKAMDECFGFDISPSTLFNIRRKLIACQLGKNIAVPVFAMREDLKISFIDALQNILGKPRSISSNDDLSQVWEYQELTVWVGFLPCKSGIDNGLHLGEALPKVSGKKWREEMNNNGQQRQRIWKRLITSINVDEYLVLPLVALSWGTQINPSRDPKPWLRDLLNRFGWIGKFYLQSDQVPQYDSHIKNERIKLNISLLSQFKNHGIVPLDMPAFLQNSNVKNLASLTVIKNSSENIPIVWYVDQNNKTKIGLRNNAGSLNWYSTIEAANALASRDKQSPYSFARNGQNQKEQSIIFWAALVKELDQAPTLLLVDGMASRASFSHFMNKEFAFDYTSTRYLIISRIIASDSAQYFAYGKTKKASLKSDMSGIYSHTGNPRRSFLLGSKNAQKPYAKSKLENRFLDFEDALLIESEAKEFITLDLDLDLDFDKDEIKRVYEGSGQGSQMRQLVECVITDMPSNLQENYDFIQYIHGLVQTLQKAHLHYDKSTNLPYPLHELKGFAADMIKVTQVDGIPFS